MPHDRPRKPLRVLVRLRNRGVFQLPVHHLPPRGGTMQQTRVVNRRHEPFDVYIGRGSIWGNPFVIPYDGDRDEVIQKYETYIRMRPSLLNQLHRLEGKRLGCYCAPQACHGDVLVRLIEERKKEKWND